MGAKLAKRLVEPDYWTCPHGNRVRPEPYLTYGPEVADLCARADFAPDPQQELGLDLIFAIRPDGSPASFAGCVICCRQNLKTGLFKQAAIGWVYVTEEPTVVWSAHEMSTTTDAQRDLENLITGKPFLSKHLASGVTNGIFYGSLGQRIEFRTGQILFKARTETGGRGLARRKLILDEAFALTKAMMGAVVPVLMAQENAQMLYGSSAGKADSEVLLDVRDRGRHGKSPRLFYLEWCAPREACASSDCTHPKDALAAGMDCALDRERLLQKANPALTTGRITMERLRDLRQEMPPEEYARECLGWWDDPADLNLFGTGKWTACRGARPHGVRIAALGVEVEADLSFASIVAAGVAADRVIVRPLQHGPGDDWIAARLKSLQASTGAPVVLDGTGPAVELVPRLKKSHVRHEILPARQARDAFDALFRLVSDGNLLHEGYPELDAAVKGAVAVVSGDRRKWGRWKSTSVISPLGAATVAAYWASKPKRAVPPPARERIRSDSSFDLSDLASVGF